MNSEPWIYYIDIAFEAQCQCDMIRSFIVFMNSICIHYIEIDDCMQTRKSDDKDYKYSNIQIFEYILNDRDNNIVYCLQTIQNDSINESPNLDRFQFDIPYSNGENYENSTNIHER